MAPRLRTRVSNVRQRFPARAVGALLLAAALGAGIALLLTEVDLGDDESPPAPAPPVVVREIPEPSEPSEVGFPAFATKNTTRVGGEDAIADAAGVALAVFPSIGGTERPAATAMVASADWPAGVAASVLMAEPIRAPVLISESDDVPELTLSALVELRPEGSPKTDNAQLFRIGDVAVPQGLRTTEVAPGSPAALAAEIARLRERLTGDPPAHLVLATSDDPGFAMPAAAWAARSGDPVLFVQRNEVPEPTLDVLKRNKDVPVYALGPTSVISERALEQVKKVAPGVRRVAGADPVANAIAFARFAEGSFGWNINDPGHGLVIANVARPLDAAAAAPLSAGGTWGPLLLTESATSLPAALRAYLLDIKPGYHDDPTRAVYNHVWVIGDGEAIDVAVQAQVDELAEVTRIQSGTGAPLPGPPPGRPEQEP